MSTFSGRKVIENRFLNLIGAQAFIYLVKNMKKLNPMIVRRMTQPESVSLFKDGYLEINNFLTQGKLVAAQSIFDQLMRTPGNADIIDNDTVVRRTEFCFKDIENLQEYDFVRDIMLKVNDVLSEVTDEKITKESAIWFDEITNGKQPSSQSDWHTDIYRDVYKVWYFPFEVVEDSGPLELGPGSHKFSINRLFLEYVYSNKSNELERGSWRFKSHEHDRLYATPRKFDCEANTLIIVNTHAMHRRSIGKPGSTRRQCHVSVRSY